MIVKFITMKGASNIASAPFYRGFVQHDRTMSKRETYDYCAERNSLELALRLDDAIRYDLSDVVPTRT